MSSEADAGPEEETVTAVTVCEARETDTQTILLGRHDEPQPLQVAEDLEGAVVYVRRRYEPINVVSLPGSMTPAEVREWLADHRDHRGFAEYDWGAHDRRLLLERHIEERADYRNLVSSTVDRLEEVPIVSHSAGSAVAAIQQDLLDALQTGTPYVVDRTPDEDGDDDGR